jgi:hypothetical protein
VPKRKTVSIAKMIRAINYMCRATAPDRADVRQGAMYVLEGFLHEKGNYKVFRYLLTGECEGAPGVNYQGNMPHPDINLRFEGTDRTRVEYYC